MVSPSRPSEEDGPSHLRRHLAAAVIRLRTARGWNQQDLAQRASISQKFISEIERGIGNPTIESLKKLAVALDWQPGAEPAATFRDVVHALLISELTGLRARLDGWHTLLNEGGAR